MKKRIAALVMALLLLTPLAASPSTAADSVYFTAVNETVLELSDATMPFWSDGYLYVAGTVFSSGDAASGDVGLSYSYSNNKQTAVVYATLNPSRALVFSLSENMVSDSDTNNYYPPALRRNGSVFLPVALIATYFGLTYSRVAVTHGYLIRIRSAGSVLSDSVFLELGSSQLTNRYNQYQRKNNQSSTGQSGGTTTTPAAPTTPQQPTAKPEPDEPAAPAAQGKQITLCFRLTDNDQTAALLTLLETQGAHAAFYLPAAQISKSADLLRRMVAGGQTLGLIASGSSGVTAQLEQGNRALFEAVGIKTRFVYLEGAAQSAADAVAAAGYCSLRPTLDRGSAGLRSASNAAYLLGRIGAQTDDVSVWLSDNVTPAGLSPLLTDALAGGNGFQGPREIDG